MIEAPRGRRAGSGGAGWLQHEPRLVLADLVQVDLRRGAVQGLDEETGALAGESSPTGERVALVAPKPGYESASDRRKRQQQAGPSAAGRSEKGAR